MGDGESDPISNPLGGTELPGSAVFLLLGGSKHTLASPPPATAGVGALRLALRPSQTPGLSGNSVLPVGGGQAVGEALSSLLSPWASSSLLELDLNPMSMLLISLQETYALPGTGYNTGYK